ncbi:MAG TPA: glycosyltransferase family 4 protein [Solirubrobacterales bacterium]|nr:glycosyltransferase family 4 protein [Solirubrobacterales bacterium]
MSAGGERFGGLRWRLRASRALWRRGATPDAVAGAMPTGPRSSEPVAQLDEPEAGDSVEGALHVRGWLFFPEEATARVEVFLGGRSLGLARIGAPRLDVAEVWDASYAAAGFELDADLGGWDGGEGGHDLTVVATSVAGERHEIEPVRVTVGAPPGRSEQPAPPAAPTGVPGSDRRPRVLVFTHQLTLGGAQLYLLDLLRQLTRAEAASFTMVTAIDGPLRSEVEALGIPVHISPLAPYDDLGPHLGRVEELAAWSGAQGFDAALLNTATAWTVPGAEAAVEIGVPFVWAIHESFPLSVLLADFATEVRERAEAALARASALVFEAEATKRLYEPVAGAERCVMHPYGLDLEPIDAHRAEFDGAAARRRAGIPADAELIACVGTVEPRKAQAMLAQAFDLVAARHPRAWVAFVGGRDDDNTEALRRYVEASPQAERMRIVPVTPEVEAWYGMADVLVCASDIESTPRTVLEAMAWETPVLGTRVFGLPELIDDGETGWLCEPRDLPALAAALDRVLSLPAEERRRIGAAGRPLVAERHSLERYGSEIAALLERAVATGAER